MSVDLRFVDDPFSPNLLFGVSAWVNLASAPIAGVVDLGFGILSKSGPDCRIIGRNVTRRFVRSSAGGSQSIFGRGGAKQTIVSGVTFV